MRTIKAFLVALALWLKFSFWHIGIDKCYKAFDYSLFFNLSKDYVRFYVKDKVGKRTNYYKSFGFSKLYKAVKSSMR